MHTQGKNTRISIWPMTGNMTPTFSVIIPNYNHGRYLNQRISSVLNQTFQDFELILLDDASSDDSVDILMQFEKHPKVSSFIINRRNSGSTFKQWDKGISLSRGKWIWIAESDDYADPFFLETMAGLIAGFPEAGLIYCDSIVVDDKGNMLSTKERDCSERNISEYSSEEFLSRKLPVFNPISNASMMVFKRSLSPRGKDRMQYRKMKYCGDWLFYIILSRKASVVHIPMALNYNRKHSNSVTKVANEQGTRFIEGIDILQYLCKLFKDKETLISLWMELYVNADDMINEITRKIIRKKLLFSFTKGWICYKKISRDRKYV